MDSISRALLQTSLVALLRASHLHLGGNPTHHHHCHSSPCSHFTRRACNCWHQLSSNKMIANSQPSHSDSFKPIQLYYSIFGKGSRRTLPLFSLPNSLCAISDVSLLYCRCDLETSNLSPHIADRNQICQNVSRPQPLPLFLISTRSTRRQKGSLAFAGATEDFPTECNLVTQFLCVNHIATFATCTSLLASTVQMLQGGKRTHTPWWCELHKP